jgi:DnaJ domain
MLLNAGLLALWPVLPVLIACYVRQLLIARRTRPVFALRKSEADELHRARRLFGQVCERINKISQQAEPRTGLWGFFPGLPPDAATANADEMDDLHAHAQHLQATIRRLTRLPLERLNYWVHVRSSRFACGAAVAAHVAALALLLALFHVFEQPVWAQQLVASTNRGAWYPFDERIFQANAVATGYACIAAALFYFVRRALLRRACSLEFSFFRQFAKNGPVQAGDQPEPEQPGDEPANGTEAGSVDDDGNWIAVLGVSAQATINEVKHAYKILIKKNHPDRVQDMSPAFRTLAEAETRKINAAYRQALQCVETV